MHLFVVHCLFVVIECFLQPLITHAALHPIVAAYGCKAIRTAILNQDTVRNMFLFSFSISMPITYNPRIIFQKFSLLRPILTLLTSAMGSEVYVEHISMQTTPVKRLSIETPGNENLHEVECKQQQPKQKRRGMNNPQARIYFAELCDMWKK